jgi:hypothetical protein
VLVPASGEVNRSMSKSGSGDAETGELIAKQSIGIYVVSFKMMRLSSKKRDSACPIQKARAGSKLGDITNFRNPSLIQVWRTNNTASSGGSHRPLLLVLRVTDGKPKSQGGDNSLKVLRKKISASGTKLVTGIHRIMIFKFF